MTTNLVNLADTIRRVDPARIRRMYPSETQFNRYVDLKQRAAELLERIPVGGLPEPLVNEIEALTGEISDLSNEISPNTELGGRLLVNEMVIWAETLHLENAIYLAGRCDELNVKEPYRTQIRLQPAHACATRYRQVYQIYDWIRENIHASPSGEVSHALFGMLSALLYQFESFASAARKDNPNHVLATYMLALAKLFRAFSHKMNGSSVEFEATAKAAEGLVGSLREPTNDSLRVELQYYKRIHKEFSEFERMRARHKAIADRIDFLGERAARILDADGGREPRCHFWFTEYVGGAARAASVVGFVCATAGALGVDPVSIVGAVNDTWEIATSSIPEMTSNPLFPSSGAVGLDTGGLAQFTPNATMTDTGGLV